MSQSSAQSTSRSWESLHLFYHRGSTDSDALLLNAIAPTMNDAQQRKDLTSWFFVRYWQGGPHFRIRFRESRPAASGEICRTLAGHLATRTKNDTPLEPAEYYRSFTARDTDPVATYGWHSDHSIVRSRYVPETERYGGAVGLAVSEDMFGVSTQAALAAIRLSPDRDRRLDLSLSTLLATVLGLGVDSLTAAGWLRAYSFSFSFSSEVAALPTADLRLHAEREYFRKVDACVHRLRSVERELVEGRPESSLICWWNQQVRSYVARYVQADRDGELSSSPLEVMQSQLHMFHNRLGIAITDECYLSWLASVILLRADGAGRFFDDSLKAPDRRYHEESKYFATEMESQRPIGGENSGGRPSQSGTEQLFRDVGGATATDGVRPRARGARRWDRPAIELPDLDLNDPLSTPLAEALLARRTSWRLYGPVTLPELATLLGFSVGVSDSREPSGVQPHGTPAFRTYPSPGAMYPTDVFVYARNVVGLEPGVFIYSADKHVLYPVAGPVDDSTLLALSLYTADPRHPVAENATHIPLWIFFAADLEHMRRMYGARSYRLVNLECGHIAQNIALVATALEMAAMPLGSFYDDAVNQAVLNDGVNRSVLYLMLVGKRQSPGLGES